MAKTSINIQPVKGGSEEHNQRSKELDYVRPELSNKNESWISESISDRLEFIKQNTKEKTGRAMQKKATPIREGVVVISEKTTLQDLHLFAKKAKEKFRIKAIQIYTHKDEGHFKDQDKKEWKPNLHAHIVFDWTNHETGKSIKLNRQDMAQLQTLLAESLGMERGISSDKVHLEAQQFKNEAEIRRLESILAERQENIRKAEEELKNAKLKDNTSKTIGRAIGKIYELMGETKGEKKLKELNQENTKLKTKIQKDTQLIQSLKEKYEREKNNREFFRESYYKALSIIEERKSQTKKVTLEILNLIKQSKIPITILDKTHTAAYINQGLEYLKDEKINNEKVHDEKVNIEKITYRRGRGR